MTDTDFDALGPQMTEIGQALTKVAGGDPEGMFLYVEIAEGWVSASVFKDEGAAIRNLDTEEPGFSDLLFDVWYSIPKGKRWSVMEYDIKDGKFEVSFRYPEEVDVKVYDRGRRQAALRARYGDRPVIYPPPPAGAYELKP